ncbi:MAG: DUF2164 domain-containing protein [Ghiorsea sp.]
MNFTEDEQEILAQKLKTYCSNELDMPLGQFEAQDLLDFISKEIGAHYYNQGLYDAQALISSKVDILTDAVYEIEKPTSMRGS